MKNPHKIFLGTLYLTIAIFTVSCGKETRNSIPSPQEKKNLSASESINENGSNLFMPVLSEEPQETIETSKVEKAIEESKPSINEEITAQQPKNEAPTTTVDEPKKPIQEPMTQETEEKLDDIVQSLDMRLAEIEEAEEKNNWNDTKEKAITAILDRLDVSITQYNNLDPNEPDEWAPPSFDGTVYPPKRLMEYLETVVLSVARDLSEKLDMMIEYLNYHKFQNKKIEIMQEILESIKFHVHYLDNIGKEDFKFHMLELLKGHFSQTFDLGNHTERRDILEKVILQKLQRLSWHLKNTELLQDPWKQDEFIKSIETRYSEAVEKRKQDSMPFWRLLEYLDSKKSKEEKKEDFKSISKIIDNRRAEDKITSVPLNIK